MKNRKKGWEGPIKEVFYENADPRVKDLMRLKDDTIEIQQRAITAIGNLINEINERINQRLEKVSEKENSKNSSWRVYRNDV